MDERERWNERYRDNEGPTTPNARLINYKHLLKRGLALDLAGGIGQNAGLLDEWHVVIADISDQALVRAAGMRVQCSAPALPFRSAIFDTIICTYFFERGVDYATLLKPNGTLFFETFILQDAKYRPDFNPAHRLDPARRAEIFRGLETIVWQETDDGRRVFATFIGRKGSV